jgi:hypothetical protein
MIADLRARGVRWDDLTTDERTAHIGWFRTVRWIEILKIREGWTNGG